MTARIAGRVDSRLQVRQPPKPEKPAIVTAASRKGSGGDAGMARGQSRQDEVLWQVYQLNAKTRADDRDPA